MSLQHEAIDKAKGKMEKTISALVSELCQHPRRTVPTPSS